MIKSPIEVLLEKGVITELIFNPGHYEYRCDDPQKIVFAIEAYADQFRDTQKDKGNYALKLQANSYLRIRSVLYMMHSEMKSRNFSDDTLRWYIPSYIIEFMQLQDYFDAESKPCSDVALFNILVYPNYNDTLVISCVNNINLKSESTFVVRDFLESKYKVELL